MTLILSNGGRLCAEDLNAAGLICWGGLLNPTIAGLDTSPCGVFDLQVIPNDDPARGDTSALLEQEFLQSLEAALRQHANTYKVWNLSLGTDATCSLDEFSELAVELDDLQEKETGDTPNFGQFCYVSSWTDDETESIPMWNMYSSLESGIRIKLRANPFKLYKNSPNDISKIKLLSIIR